MSSSPETQSRRGALELHQRAFLDRFGRSGGEPLLCFAPGRVNLFGAHLDYNGGPVMPTAIDRGTFLALRPRSDGRVLLAAEREEQVFEGRHGELPDQASGAWFDYPLGVIRDMALPGEAGSRELPGLELLAGGDLPIGAGLSSSASICVGTAFGMDLLAGGGEGPEDWIRHALAAERGFVGVKCGIMDPHAVGLARPGHLLWLDCRDGSHQHIPLDFDSVAVAVADTGVRRELAAGEFNRRVEQCAAAYGQLSGAARDRGLDVQCLRDVPLDVLEEHAARLDPVLLRRARHVITEVQRALAAREALQAGDAREMGRLMLETQRSLREDFEVSSPELDTLIESASRAKGAFGGRLTGAGFGGCAVILLEAGAEDEVREALQTGFEEKHGRRPEVAFYRGDAGPRRVLLD